MGNSRPSLLGNKYVLLDLIGAGGMSEVYRCKLSGSEGFEKIIVLKKLLPQANQDKEIVANFIDEARLAALLQHENITHIYDFGEIDENYFIAMEYLFGKDLYTISLRAKEYNEIIGVEKGLLIASKICEGMEYAHTLKDLQQRPLNIIHRDLSPHNVFITYDGKVKIIDFGIAKAELFDNKTKAGVIKGKISYMSPEQLSDEPTDLRSDIFSIGIMLYEMLSGKRMYTGDTATLIQKCKDVEYEKLENIRPGLPKQVYAILDRALQADKKKRYQSCAEMREDIDDCLFSLLQRQKAQILKEYILRLFAKDYEDEKRKLFATTEKFDEIYGVGKSNAGKVTGGLGADSSDARKRGDVSGDNTLVLDQSGGKGSIFYPLQQWLQSFWLFSSPKKLAAGVSSFFVFIFIVLITLVRIISNDPELERVKEIDQLVVENVGEADLTSVPQPLTETQNIEFENKILTNDDIQRLLVKAKQAFDQDRLTIPEENSAFHYYTQVLETEPENLMAQQGMIAIIEKYAQWIENELYGNKLPEAEKHVEQGLSVYPKNARLITLKTLITKEKKRLIEELDWRAQRSLGKNDLTTPVDDCAYKYYKDIQKIDRYNPIALKGMQMIGDKYAVMADSSYRNLNLEKARDYVEKGLKVVPTHKILLQLQRDLTRSKPGIFFKMLEKNIKSIDL